MHVQVHVQVFHTCTLCIAQLLKTGEEVAELQADLEEMQPQLEQAQIETEQTMAKIEKDSGILKLHTLYIIYMYIVYTCMYLFIYMYMIVQCIQVLKKWRCRVATCEKLWKQEVLFARILAQSCV